MGVEIAEKARERFGIFLAIGIVSMLFWQLVVNLGGVLGLMPLTGVTLPLMSYGGSSVVAILISIGILQNISRRRFMF
jgi:rod shape determining protein RodA